MAAPGHQLALEVLVPVPSLRSGTSESQVGGPRKGLPHTGIFLPEWFEARILEALPVYVELLPSAPL